MKLYLISGSGADERIFVNLKIDAEIIHIPWIMPKENEDFSEYARRLSSSIDTSEEFCLGGLSFGGMCAQEIAKFLKPEKLILISTAKSPNEFPPQIRFAFKSGLYKLVPDAIYKRLAYGASRLIGVIKKDSRAKFKNMVASVDKRIFGWSVAKMATWQGGGDFPYLHLHSTTDKILPMAYIKNATFIRGGGHLMVLNRAKDVSALINKYLKD